MFVLWNAFVVSLLIVTVTAPVVAEEHGTFKDDPSSGQEAGGCAQAGTLDAYFKTCTTNWGTLSEITSPFGEDMLALEGYALCSLDGTKAVETGHGVGFGFGTPTTSTPTSNVRKTLDGKFQITQTFLRDAVEKEIIITVTIRNISTAAIQGVSFSRFFDADIYIGGGHDYAGTTRRSVFIWNKEDDIAPAGYSYNPEKDRGLELTARTYTFPSQAQLVSYGSFNPLMDECLLKFPPDIIQPVSPNDWTGRLSYAIGTIAAGASKIVKFVYRVM